MAKRLELFMNALKFGRRFPHNSNDNQKKTVRNELKSQQDRGEVGGLLEAKFN